MASRRKYVAGRSTKDLLKMDSDTFLKLSKPELREVVSRLADAANKRLKRLHYPTPAQEEAKRSGGKFTTKGRNLNQLRGEYIRIRNFMLDPTSTNKGMQEFIKETKDKIKETIGVDMTDEEFFDFWDIYKRLYHEYPAQMRDKRFKYEIWRKINESLIPENMSGKSRDEILLEIKQKAEKEYQEMQAKNGKYAGVSDYF